MLTHTYSNNSQFGDHVIWFTSNIYNQINTGDWNSRERKMKYDATKNFFLIICCKLNWDQSWHWSLAHPEEYEAIEFKAKKSENYVNSLIVMETLTVFSVHVHVCKC